ncbi:MAG TPA: glycosyltransferase [Methanotrichaceae archaeon]|nr:glycosyltransferase [Methanotrichaceae archaeon]
MSKRSKLRFATFFPVCQDIHLTKDVGMIPYILQRDFGYDSYMICYRNGDYPHLETDVPGLKMLFLEPNDIPLLRKDTPNLEKDSPLLKKNTPVLGRNIPFLGKKISFLSMQSSFSRKLQLMSTLMDALVLMRRWGREIDILQLYHLKPESIWMGVIYRAINRHGVLYLKLDLDVGTIARYREEPELRSGFSLRSFFSLRSLLFRLASFDIISAETKEVYTIVRDFFPFFKNYRDKIYYIPNGIDMQSVRPLSMPFISKENKILHAGRIGEYQKASELALEAFSSISKEFPDWELDLVGPMSDKFLKQVEDIKARDILAADRITCLGFVERRELYRCYKEAKILMIPSRWESFGLVAAEAGAFGDVILGSDIPPFRDLTDDGKLGYLCPVDDVECLKKRLRHMLSHNEELGIKSNQISEFIKENFDWKAVCGKLNELILHHEQGAIRDDIRQIPDGTVMKRDN